MIFYEGEVFKNDSDFKLNINSSFLFGINVFEGIKVYYLKESQEWKFFLLDEHLQRLAQNASAVGLNFDEEKTRSIVESCLTKLPLQRHADYYFRVVLFCCGESWSSSEESNILIKISKFNSFQYRKYAANLVNLKKGYADSNPAYIKAGSNYLNSRYGFIAAGNKLPIYIDREGFLTESGGSSLLLSVNGNVFTYPLDTGLVLPSITVKFLKSSCGIPIIENPVHKSLLHTVDGAVLVGTGMDIGIITSIGKLELDRSEKLAMDIGSLYGKAIKKYFK